MKLSRMRSILREERSRMCFCATAIFGAIAYLYLFLNNINNNDMIACIPYGYGSGLSSGRWMLHILNILWDKLWGSYSVPLFHGLLSLLILAFTCVVLVRAFEIQSKWSAFALSAITVTAAPIGSIFFFLFTSHFYMLALLLMALSIYILRKKCVWAFVLAVCFAACSLGIYQAYFPFFAVALMLQLLSQTLKKEQSFKQWLLCAGKSAAALVLSYLLYYLILQVLLRVFSQQISDYQGLNSMGSIDLSAITQAYYHYFGIFTHNYVGFSATGIVRIVILLLLLLSVAGVAVLWKTSKHKLQPLFATLIFLLLPLAANAFLMIASQSTIYTRMTMGLVALFYFPMILWSKLANMKRMQLFVCLLLLLCSLNYAWQSNGNYMWVSYANEKASNYFTTLFTRAKMLDGYHESMEIVFIGSEIDDESYRDNWYGTPFLYGGRTGAVGQINQYSKDSLIRNYLGYEYRQITPTEEETFADIIAQMDSYPNDGSLRIIEDMVFVKLEE